MTGFVGGGAGLGSGAGFGGSAGLGGGGAGLGCSGGLGLSGGLIWMSLMYLQALQQSFLESSSGLKWPETYTLLFFSSKFWLWISGNWAMTLRIFL